jgi:hypothetical protein
MTQAQLGDEQKSSKHKLGADATSNAIKRVLVALLRTIPFVGPPLADLISAVLDSQDEHRNAAQLDRILELLSQLKARLVEKVGEQDRQNQSNTQESGTNQVPTEKIEWPGEVGIQLAINREDFWLGESYRFGEVVIIPVIPDQERHLKTRDREGFNVHVTQDGILVATIWYDSKSYKRITRSIKERQRLPPGSQSHDWQFTRITPGQYYDLKDKLCTVVTFDRKLVAVAWLIQHTKVSTTIDDTYLIVLKKTLPQGN